MKMRVRLPLQEGQRQGKGAGRKGRGVEDVPAGMGPGLPVEAVNLQDLALGEISLVGVGRQSPAHFLHNSPVLCLLALRLLSLVFLNVSVQ